MFREERRLRPNPVQPMAGQQIMPDTQEERRPSPGAGEEATGAILPSVEERAVPHEGQDFQLANDFIELRISSIGGGIRSVALQKYAESLQSENRWVFNAGSANDALTMKLAEVDENIAALPFEAVDRGPDFLRLRADIDGEWSLERSYRLQPAGKDSEPYLIHHEIHLIHRNRLQDPAVDGDVDANGTSTDRRRPLTHRVLLTLGSLPRTEGDPTGDHLNFSFYNGKKASFINSRAFASSNGLFGLGRREARRTIEGTGPIVWGAIKNQFFTAILTPAENAEAYQAMAPAPQRSKERTIGGSLLVPMDRCDDGYLAAMDYYVGPKEYARLDRLGQRQDLVMQFGWLGFISKILLLMMTGIHSLIPNWGWTIICLTVLVKLALWPLTNAQVRSTRGMAKLQKPLKMIQEKYRNNPKKVQLETLKLFRENRINPAAGCLPIFIQIPIFLGLYFMLRTASELRFANFLWIRDLSVADTVGHWGGWPINPLPILMGLTMFVQMQMTPNTMQSGAQKRVFQFMPLIFLFCCYRFPSGLVLYWTVQNLLTIFQQWMINRRLAKEEQIAAQTSKGRSRKKVSRAAGKF